MSELPPDPLESATEEHDRWKERFDAFVKLAEFRMEVRKERRHHEWRVSLGLWVGMAGGMAAFKEKGLSSIGLGFFLILVALTHALWVQWNYERNVRDATRA
jgi:hypothetical protein